MLEKGLKRGESTYRTRQAWTEKCPCYSVLYPSMESICEKKERKKGETGIALSVAKPYPLSTVFMTLRKSIVS